MPVENIDKDKCIGCGTCIETCPMDVLRLDETSGQSKIVYPQDCQICHLCRIFCPEDAITISPVKYVRPMVGWG
ncbi:[Fe-S]-binding protein [Desulfobacter hydrogenophilus]|uniref:Ferredoxin family protein n=1 Tax=Desulfobacter hydrogenophilus TaxID=2291 RepID=A0A328FAT8_9BACT|nr:ferredoxin family protein [Desulfobacter hydrogenophilus]NDY74164.1 ferredoxin family protein [Desulfobacter hydrogenophilus]QBH12589.1 ferredoxin family protein [Desulfobacter hydrogenophilus]RAM00245.1 [Fe-S]-binding protein [Desulfobacter hydrogenophilus]